MVLKCGNNIAIYRKTTSVIVGNFINYVKLAGRLTFQPPRESERVSEGRKSLLFAPCQLGLLADFILVLAANID